MVAAKRLYPARLLRQMGQLHHAVTHPMARPQGADSRCVALEGQTSRHDEPTRVQAVEKVHGAFAEMPKSIVHSVNVRVRCGGPPYAPLMRTPSPDQLTP